MFKTIKNKFLNLFGYVKYVKITNREAKPVWIRTKRFSFTNLAKHLLCKITRKRSNYKIIYREAPSGAISHNNHEIIPGVYTFYVKPEIIAHAVKNSIRHFGQEKGKVSFTITDELRKQLEHEHYQLMERMWKRVREEDKTSQ